MPDIVPRNLPAEYTLPAPSHIACSFLPASFVNRAWRRLSLPYLYRVISTDQPGEVAAMLKQHGLERQAELLDFAPLVTAKRAPPPAEADDGTEHPPVSAPSAQEGFALAVAKENERRRLESLVVATAPHIRALVLRYTVSSEDAEWLKEKEVHADVDYCECGRTLFAILPSSLPSMPSLTRLDISLSHGGNFDILARLASVAPNLTHLKLRSSSYPVDFYAGRRTRNFAFPKLRSLELEYLNMTFDYFYHLCITSLIEPVRETLEHLFLNTRLNGEFVDLDEILDQPFPRRLTLSVQTYNFIVEPNTVVALFPALASLSLPTDGNNAVPNLPSSLKHLEVTRLHADQFPALSDNLIPLLEADSLHFLYLTLNFALNEGEGPCLPTEAAASVERLIGLCEQRGVEIGGNFFTALETASNKSYVPSEGGGSEAELSSEDEESVEGDAEDASWEVEDLPECRVMWSEEKRLEWDAEQALAPLSSHFASEELFETAKRTAVEAMLSCRGG
ncbi:hypothetical protein JCM10213_004424 [Rhodosporidiobolus nylandii]